ALVMRGAVGGDGSWGTGRGIHLARAGADVRMWAREPEVAEGLARSHRNPIYLTDIECPARLTATTDHVNALQGAELILVVVPSEFVAATLKDLPPIPAAVPVASATTAPDPPRP